VEDSSDYILSLLLPGFINCLNCCLVVDVDVAVTVFSAASFCHFNPREDPC